MWITPWVINVALIVGLRKVGRKARGGFLWLGFGEFAWVAWAGYTEQYALAFICLVFGALQFDNYRKWGLDEPETVHPTSRGPEAA